MTAAKHREAPAASGSRTVVNSGGTHLWAVAWRLHRAQIAVLAAVIVAAAAAMVLFRWRLLAAYAEFRCDPADSADCVDPSGTSVLWGQGFSSWSHLAHLAMVGGPVVLGVFAAASIFTREFGRGTQVLALTQSIRRSPWFAVKSTIVGLPLVAGLLLLGYLLEWMDDALAVTAGGALRDVNFFARNIMPAAIGAAAFALTLALGMALRSVVATLVVGMIAGLGLLAGAVFGQPHVLPADRTLVTLAEEYGPVTEAQFAADGYGLRLAGNSIFVGDGFGDREEPLQVGQGYADAEGRTVVSGADFWNATSTCYDGAQVAAAVTVGLTPDEDGNYWAQTAEDDAKMMTAAYQNAYNASMLDCLAERGIVTQYTDVLPGTLLWPLRAVMTGGLALLAALFITAGRALLPRAVAKR